MKNGSTLGSYIRSLRIQNEMTQTRLAYRLGVTDKPVSKWERDLSFPDISLFPKLADVLGVKVEDLLKESLLEGRPSRLLQIFGMSHDIRTPLHIIIGCANLAELHMEDKEALRRYLESIRISGEYLVKTIDRLMQVAGKDEDEQPENAGKKAAEGDKAAEEGKAAEGNTEAKGEITGPAGDMELEQYLEHRAKARENALEEYDFTGKRILVAEDFQINREIAAEFLKHTGAEVEFAEDGRECVRMVEQAPAGYYDLILMDIMMPNMDGLEATRRIRKLEDPVKAAVPIIALSANVYDKDRKGALEAGMNAFAEKPIYIDRLFETMGQYL